MLKIPYHLLYVWLASHVNYHCLTINIHLFLAKNSISILFENISQLSYCVAFGRAAFAHTCTRAHCCSLRCVALVRVWVVWMWLEVRTRDLQRASTVPDLRLSASVTVTCYKSCHGLFLFMLLLSLYKRRLRHTLHSFSCSWAFVRLLGPLSRTTDSTCSTWTSWICSIAANRMRNFRDLMVFSRSWLVKVSVGLLKHWWNGWNTIILWLTDNSCRLFKLQRAALNSLAGSIWSPGHSLPGGGARTGAAAEATRLIVTLFASFDPIVSLFLRGKWKRVFRQWHFNTEI